MNILSDIKDNLRIPDETFLEIHSYTILIKYNDNYYQLNKYLPALIDL